MHAYPAFRASASAQARSAFALVPGQLPGQLPTSLRRQPSLSFPDTCRRTVCCAAQPVARRQFAKILLTAAAAGAIASTGVPAPVGAARPEGVNRPELLPKEFTTVIDLEKFLSSGEVRRLREKIGDLEDRTGYKVRVLTQRFPQTPGLAIRDYWNVDDETVVIVADYFGGAQLLKFNVGLNVDAKLPPRFWSILSANLGNKFYVQENGEAAAIARSVDTVRACLLANGCKAPPPNDVDIKF